MTPQDLPGGAAGLRSIRLVRFPADLDRVCVEAMFMDGLRIAVNFIEGSPACDVAGAVSKSVSECRPTAVERNRNAIAVLSEALTIALASTGTVRMADVDDPSLVKAWNMTVFRAALRAVAPRLSYERAMEIVAAEFGG